MKKIDFHNKRFALIENSEKGTVNKDTVFEFQQTGDLVTATYYGGPIKLGKIIALLKKDTLDMRYHCVTSENELKAGKAMAKISHTDLGKIKLTLRWEWLDSSNEKGISEYLEH
ncbi:hypothetical protein [Muriicola sp.]|uniref:hypothetical protein n=1 Tax=Muriicola sp. TaxID=2020856 RepID=UPI003C751B5D